MTSIRSPQQLGAALRAARTLQSASEHCFSGNGVVERIIALIEQRCALTIRRLTNFTTETPH